MSNKQAFPQPHLGNQGMTYREYALVEIAKAMVMPGSTIAFSDIPVEAAKIVDGLLKQSESTIRPY